ncbi:MAG: XRE family transcriptional regulator, partial [Sedimentibacter sp.]
MQEEDFLCKNINVMQPVDIAKELGRTENCVNIKIHRMRLPVNKGGRLKERVSRNIVHEMLTQRIGTPDNFRPTREFLERVGIGQKRFWQLYR